MVKGTDAPTRFDGTVNVTYVDAMLASTKSAWMLRDDNGEATFFIPPDDIYFGFMDESKGETQSSVFGIVRRWDISAVGRGVRQAMYTVEEAAPGFECLDGHGLFDASKVTVAAVPDPGELHKPQIH